MKILNLKLETYYFKLKHMYLRACDFYCYSAASLYTFFYEVDHTWDSFSTFFDPVFTVENSLVAWYVILLPYLERRRNFGLDGDLAAAADIQT